MNCALIQVKIVERRCVVSRCWSRFHIHPSLQDYDTLLIAAINNDSLPDELAPSLGGRRPRFAAYKKSEVTRKETEPHTEEKGTLKE